MSRSKSPSIKSIGPEIMALVRKRMIYQHIKHDLEISRDWQPLIAKQWEEYENSPHGWWAYVEGKNKNFYGNLPILKKFVWSDD